MSNTYNTEPATLSDFYGQSVPPTQENLDLASPSSGVPESEEHIRTPEDIIRESTQPAPTTVVNNNVVPMIDPNAEQERALRIQQLKALQEREAKEAYEAQQRQIAEYRERTALEAEARAKAYFPEESLSELPENLKEDYQTLAPIMQHAVRQAIAEERKRNLAYARDQELRIKNFEAQLESARAAQSQVLGSQIDRDIMQLVPDAAVVTSTPAFQQFRDGIDPRTGLSRRTLINAAYHEGNARAVANILDEFKQSTGAFGSGASPRPTLNSGPTTKQSSKPLYRASDYEEATRKYMAGLMDEATWTKIDNEYTQAALEGRVAS